MLHRTETLLAHLECMLPRPSGVKTLRSAARQLRTMQRLMAGSHAGLHTARRRRHEREPVDHAPAVPELVSQFAPLLANEAVGVDEMRASPRGAVGRPAQGVRRAAAQVVRMAAAQVVRRAASQVQPAREPADAPAVSSNEEASTTPPSVRRAPRTARLFVQRAMPRTVAIAKPFAMSAPDPGVRSTMPASAAPTTAYPALAGVGGRAAVASPTPPSLGTPVFGTQRFMPRQSSSSARGVLAPPPPSAGLQPISGLTSASRRPDSLSGKPALASQPQPVPRSEFVGAANWAEADRATHTALRDWTTLDQSTNSREASPATTAISTRISAQARVEEDVFMVGRLAELVEGLLREDAQRHGIIA
jgi:hypothetical protein